MKKLLTLGTLILSLTAMAQESPLEQRQFGLFDNQNNNIHTSSTAKAQELDPTAQLVFDFNNNKS